MRDLPPSSPADFETLLLSAKDAMERALGVDILFND